MLNADEYFLVKKLKDLRPGLGLKLGHQVSIDTFTNIDAIPDPYKRTFAFIWNGIFNIDNIKLYDKTSGKIEKRYPLTYGAEITLNYFFKHRSKDSTRVALALNAKLVRTWNDDDLDNYKLISETTVNTSQVVAFDKFDGRYGTLEEKTKFRTSLSIPTYFWHLNPIPFVVGNFVSGEKAKYHVGLFTNFLAKRLPKARFSIPASVGMGVDWVIKGASASKPFVFFSGSIEL
jgi:hypothetical protein